MSSLGGVGGSVGGASLAAGGWADAAAGGVAASRPSTPLFGAGGHAASQGAAAGAGNNVSGGFGGFGGGNDNGHSNARARLAGLSVALPTLAEADDSSGAAVGGNDLDWSRGTTRAPAPSPEAGAARGGSNEFQRGITVVVPSADAFEPGIAVVQESAAAPKPLGARAPAQGQGQGFGGASAPPQSRPSSPAFGAAVTALAPPRLNRETVAAALNAAAAKEQMQQQQQQQQQLQQLSSQSPAAVAAVPAGSVPELCVDAAAATDAFGQPQEQSAAVGFGSPAFGAAAGGEPDALDAIAAEDAANARAQPMAGAQPFGCVSASSGAGDAFSALPPAPQSTQRPAVSAFASAFGAFGFGGSASGPFGGSGSGQGQGQAQWFGAQPQPLQHQWMTPQPNAVPPALQLQQRLISAQHMQAAAAQQRFMAQRAAAQAQAQAQAQVQVQAQAQARARAMAFQQQQQRAAMLRPVDTSAMVPACGGRCRLQQPQPRVGGLGVLTLTRTGSITCAHCGQRAFTKLATVDTDPYALTATVATSAPSVAAVVPDATPLLALTVSPQRPARDNAVPHHKAGRAAAPVSYGAVRRAVKKPHRRTLSPDFAAASDGISSSGSGGGSDENRQSGEQQNGGAEGNARATVGRNGSIGFGRALASALSHATPRCQGVGDGVTYASLKSRRTARRASALASNPLTSQPVPVAVVRPLSASFAGAGTSSAARPTTTPARRPTAVGTRSGVVVTAALSAALSAATATAY